MFLSSRVWKAEGCAREATSLATGVHVETGHTGVAAVTAIEMKCRYLSSSMYEHRHDRCTHEAIFEPQIRKAYYPFQRRPFEVADRHVNSWQGADLLTKKQKEALIVRHFFPFRSLHCQRDLSLGDSSLMHSSQIRTNLVTCRSFRQIPRRCVHFRYPYACASSD